MNDDIVSGINIFLLGDSEKFNFPDRVPSPISSPDHKTHLRLHLKHPEIQKVN